MSLSFSTIKSIVPIVGLKEQSSSIIPSITKPVVAIAREPKLTDKELDEKQAKRLCFLSNEKFTPNHKYKKKQTYVMHLIIEDDKDDGSVKEMENNSEVLDVQLSLNAMCGTHGAQTMKLKGHYGRTKLHILIDASNKHCFLCVVID
ncbi:hypothetical protein GH714_012418 [Hevea brasiliensis]|uniref:Uncharacterized protein n=1 Tax=Hevea brasiliensis TaxID=3981 RepID=A0A6A6K5D1_HEVBR|nr:hypothetical protein GH714_012252 [Hevea brasiliensis]KAF2283621.1 hypothetical protein GH714_012418 [Hevea brasiliensis]